jgi:hypothetical protein
MVTSRMRERFGGEFEICKAPGEDVITPNRKWASKVLISKTRVLCEVSRYGRSPLDSVESWRKKELAFKLLSGL